ncbi:MAG: histidine kinase [Methylobacterium frigidaeris]
MNALDPILSDGQFPSPVRDSEGTGAWAWIPAEKRLVWSPGLFRLLGLSPIGLRPDLRLLLGAVHPEDRRVFGPVAEAGGVLPDACTFRVVHPGGTVRVLWARNDAAVASGGPSVVSGSVLDITDAGRLNPAGTSEYERRVTLIEQTRTLVFSHRSGAPADRYPRFEALFEPSAAELMQDSLAVVVADQRERCRAIKLDAEQRGVLYHGTALFRMAGGDREPFRCVVVPVRDPSGTIIEWSGVVGPASVATAAVSGSVRAGLEQGIRGHHLRAARGLLGWSMTVLAAASDLSLSTVRRLEEDGEQLGARSRHKAVAALRRAGIRFVALDDGTLAVAVS